MRALLRVALFVPFAVAGAVALCSVQTAMIFGALFMRVKTDTKAREPSPAPAAAPRGPTPVTIAPDLPEAPIHTDFPSPSVLPLRPITPQSLILIAGEECYLQENARLIVGYSDPPRVGGRGGFSVGGARGLRFGARAESERKPGQPVETEGRVYVTNTRLVFIGAVNVNMHVAQILTLDRTDTGVAVSFVNEQPLQLITGNPRLGMTLHRVIHARSDPGSPLR